MIDVYFDTGSSFNLISKAVCKKLALFIEECKEISGLTLKEKRSS